MASCATVSLVDSWRSPGVTGPRLHKLLVAGIPGEDSGAPVYEEMLLRELQQHGIDATSARFASGVGKEKKTDRQALYKAARDGGFQAVLTVRTVKVEKQSYVEPGYAATSPDYFFGYPAWDYGYYGAMTFYEPPYVSTLCVATIEVNLLDAEKETLLWVATLRNFKPGNAVSIGRELAKIILQSLVKEGFI